MPSFCRHNRLVQNCPICAREQELELRPVVTPGGRSEPVSRPAAARPAASGTRVATPRTGTRSGPRMTVRKLVRDAGDGYASELVPGIHAAASAERLAEELAFAATRLERLQSDPPGLYAEVADPGGELEERTWLAVQIALLSPGDAGEDPFAAIRALRCSWGSGEAPAPAAEQAGPRAAADPARAGAAYRTWVVRQGTQAAGLEGDGAWTPERRFDRVFERLSTLPAMERVPRFDLLVTLGRLGVYPLHGTRLHLGGADRVTLAAKRILGIGDPLLLERRANELAAACGLPLEALDLGFFNWERGERTTAGLDPATQVDPDLHAGARVALGLD
jgi:hypothetical protein